MSGLRGKRYRRPELPLVPLIDVLVMLVLFAFVTMRFSTNQTLNITLPKVDTAGKNEFRGNVTIEIEKTGGLKFNGKPLADAQLLELLRQVKDLNRDTPVLVRADEGATWQRVAFVMDACRKMGLTKQNMQTR